MKWMLYVILLAPLSLENARPHRVSVSPGHYSVSEEPSANSVWLLPKNYSQYVFSSPHNMLLGLTEDGRTVDALSLATKAISYSYSLPAQGYLLAIGINGMYATVAHYSSMTFINISSTAMETGNFMYPNGPLSSLIADLLNEHESCGWIQTTESGVLECKIICVNPSGNVTECKDQAVKGCMYGYEISVFGAPDHRMIYAVSASGHIIKYIVNEVTSASTEPQCPEYQYYRWLYWGLYSYPTGGWFSYDRTRIFFNNGLTFSVSGDPSQDLQDHGSFNASFTPQYLYWVAQDSQAPNNVVALRRAVDVSSSRYQVRATTYNWPYLYATDDFEIPVPTSSSGLSVLPNNGSQVYFNPTKNTEVYIIVNYTNGEENNYTPGVAFVDITV